MPEKRRNPRKPKHDASYKRIFAHSRTTADLLRGFVGDLAPLLDFTTLERLPASFVTEHLGQRHADLLWKMQTVERRWLYLLVLLEFQSTVDSRMALRMLSWLASWLATCLDTGIFSLTSRHSTCLDIGIFSLTSKHSIRRISTSQLRRMAECLLHWPSG